MQEQTKGMGRILISVTNKANLKEWGRLAELGWEIISTGGTAKALQELGIPVTTVESVTNFPEMLDGRVKTLHPRVFGGILAVRDKPSHTDALKKHDIRPIDIVVVNLYNFAARPDIEEIDIGGPSLIRAAAKNGLWTIPVVDPADYRKVVYEFAETGDLNISDREELVRKAFRCTADYDAMIYCWMRNQPPGFLRPKPGSSH